MLNCHSVIFIEETKHLLREVAVFETCSIWDRQKGKGEISFAEKIMVYN